MAWNQALVLVKVDQNGNERESGTIPPLQPGWVVIAYFSEKPLSDVNVPPAQAGASTRIVSTAMTALELRASFSLASIFALRMLGLFLILPVFAIEAARYPGGDDTAMVGLTMGIYGLTQAMLQFLYGLASDRFGRKKVIVFGLLVFAAGSLVAALAPTLTWLAIGRAVQGAGAVSAAVTALLADQTRDEVRTKSMAMVGASIGLMFAVSLVAAPVLAGWIGLVGIFSLTGILALLGVVGTIWWVPAEPLKHKNMPKGRVADVLRSPALFRLNFGVFVLHAVQLAMWLALPAMLVKAGLSRDHHWQVYLPAVMGAFVVMGGSLFQLEKRGYLRAVFLTSIGLTVLVQAALWSQVDAAPSVALLGGLLFVFFYGFNVLEASQPSIVSRLAPPQSRGAAIGVYNTLQSLGFFAGGMGGGWLVKHVGASGLYAVCAVLMLIWLLVAWPMRAPGREQAAEKAV
jgi:MFS family permease